MRHIKRGGDDSARSMSCTEGRGRVGLRVKQGEVGAGGWRGFRVVIQVSRV